MKILIAGFQHETNTFSLSKANYMCFKIQDSWPPLLKNQEVIKQTKGTTLPIAGFIESSIKDKATKLIPVVWCSAEPSSFVTDCAYKQISKIILKGIKNNPDLDGIYLDLHGAMVVESTDDGEGNLLKMIRKIVGYRMPIVISLDMHANVSRDMFELSDAITMYRTYPHIDMPDAGMRAYEAIKYLINGGKFYKAFEEIPYLIPLHMQSTKIEPCREIYEYIKCIQDEHYKWAEFATGFPLSDVTHCRPSLMYYSNKKIERINDFKKLLKSIIMLKSKFNSKLYLPNQAVKFAKSFNHPVILADVQDNPGAGAASDNIEILEALISLKAESSLVGMINDPEVAKIAHKIGVGGKFRAKVGGKFNPAYPSLACNFKVISLSDGKFTFKGKMYKGIKANSGMTACLSIDNYSNIHIVISSVRCQALDKAVFTHLGLNLNNYKIIVLKSTVHFIDDFQSFSKTIINVKTDGLATCDLRDITFKHLNKNIETNL